MCGFLIHSSDETIEIPDSLILRGPDQYSSLDFDNVTFHHFRLSIVGLEFGTQPRDMERTIFVFNGEIYNYREIALKYKLSEMASLSDTICFHELIDLIGIDQALDVVKGHYSFVLYDKIQKKITYSRDAMGVKPLYFYCKQDSILISSDINTIASNTKSQVNKDAALEALVFGGHTGENTLYDGVHSADPDVLYTYDTKRFNLQRKLKNNPSRGIRESGSDIQRLIKDSIESQSDFDVPGVCLVSSGIDSRIVKNLTQINTNMAFVTAISEDLNLLEEDINRDPDTVHLKVGIDNSKLMFINKLKAYGTIPAHNNYFALCMLYEALGNSNIFSKKIKVALTGEGADEYFGGYGRYISLAAHAEGVKVSWIEELKLLSDNWMFLMNSRLNHNSLRWLCEQGVDLNSILLRHLDGLKNISLKDVSLSSLSKYDIQTNLRYGLIKQDVSGMLSSIEVRVPFLIQDIHRIAVNGEYAQATSKISKTILRKIAFSLGIEQNVKIGFPVSLNKFIPDDYKPSDKVKEIFEFLKDNKSIVPQEVLNSSYMLELLMSQEC